MVRLPRLVARDDQRRARAQAGGHQPMVDGPGGEQRRDGRAAGAGTLVRDEQELGTALDRGLRLVTEASARRLEPFVLVERSIERSEGEPRECRRKEEEGLELDDVRRLGNLGQERLAGAEQRPQGHDVPLPEMVDGRIGDLREPLLDVAEDRPGTARKGRKGRVVAHGRGRLVPVRGERTQDEGELLARVAARDLARQEIGLGRVDRLAGPLAAHALRPGPVRPARREDALDRPVLLEPAGNRVDGDRLAGAEPPAADTPSLRQRDRAHLGRADDEPVVDHGVAERPQPVAVERGADDAAVGEDDARRPVPGLDERRVVAVEVPHLLVELGVRLPGLGHEHGQPVAHVPAAAHEQLERVVEHARVRPGRVHDGRDQRVVGPADVALARPHPVDVPLDGVDLAVVAEEPERLGPFPRGRRVRREAVVEDPERGRHGRVAEVGVEGRQLVGGAERLVRDRAEGERDHVEPRSQLGPAARAVGPALELVGVEALGGAEGELLDPGRAREGAGAERRRVDRHLAPPERLEPLLAAAVLDGLPRALVTEEDHRQAAARLGKERRREAGGARPHRRPSCGRPRWRPGGGRRRGRRAGGRRPRGTPPRAGPRRSRCRRRRGRLRDRGVALLASILRRGRAYGWVSASVFFS